MSSFSILSRIVGVETMATMVANAAWDDLSVSSVGSLGLKRRMSSVTEKRPATFSILSRIVGVETEWIGTC